MIREEFAQFLGKLRETSNNGGDVEPETRKPVHPRGTRLPKRRAGHSPDEQPRWRYASGPNIYRGSARRQESV